MKDYLRLYFRLIGAQVRSEMQYRVSFVAEITGNLLVTGLDFAMLLILLNRFTAIGGWTLPQVAFLYGTSAVSFSLAELFVGHYDDFDQQVVRGDFDRVLIRPLPVSFQMVAGAFPLRRFGRLIQGAAVLVLALIWLQPGWNAGQWVFFAVMILGGALFFGAIFILGATSAFWSPQMNEVANIFTYGGTFMTSYPMSIYAVWLRSIFTFLIPMAFINYYPSLYLLDKPDPFGLPAWVPFLAPLVALISLRLALAAWQVGVRHYQSTGS
jgi:ABC-2 type transport system permease protein